MREDFPHVCSATASETVTMTEGGGWHGNRVLCGVSRAANFSGQVSDMVSVLIPFTYNMSILMMCFMMKADSPQFNKQFI